MTERTDRFPLVDALRAIAALSIVLVHGLGGSEVLREQGGETAHVLAANLYIGVPVFFLISGFLLYRPFALANVDAQKRPRVDHYGWRRILRIVPAYWMALTLVGVVLGAGYVFTLREGPVFYGFGQIYESRTTFMGLGPAWTLCIEITFYAFLPVFALAIRSLPASGRGGRLRNEVAGLCALFTVALVWTVWAVARSDVNTTAGQPLLDVLPAYLDHFALGMGLAVLSVWLVGRERPPGAVRLVGRLPALAWSAALALWLLSIVIAPDPGREPISSAAYVAKHVLFGLVAFGVLVPAVLGDPERGWVRRLLRTRSLLWMGLISYGIYLYHEPLLTVLARLGLHDTDFAEPLLGRGVVVALCLAFTLVLAALSYYLLERPVIRFGRSLEGRRARNEDQPGAVSVPSRPPEGGAPQAPAARPVNMDGVDDAPG